MKKSVFLLVLVQFVLMFVSATLIAQPMNSINYQAIARGASGAPLVNQSITLRFTIRHNTPFSGALLYQEQHSAITNAQGLFTVQIGGGTALVNSFANIPWKLELPTFLEIDLDADGAGPLGFANMGAQQLVSVPFAQFAKETRWIDVGNNNTRIGLSGYSLSGVENTGAGSLALNATTAGSQNAAYGANALRFNTIGNENVAIGYQALQSNTTGHQNAALGTQALFSNTDGIRNVGIGLTALYANTSGFNNVAIGYEALLENTTGAFNTAIGSEALENNTTGGANTAIGEGALSAITTGAYNTGLGAGTTPFNGAVTNYTGVGFAVGSAASASNMVEIGNASVSVIRGQVGFTTYSDARIKDKVQQNVPGLAFINQLKPVTYNLNIHRQNQIMFGNQKPDTLQWAGKYDIEKIRMTGFIAQEVATTAQKLGFDFSGVVPPQNEHDLYSLRYAEFVVPLVKAVQEQQAMIEELKKENKLLQENNKLITTEVTQLKQLLLKALPKQP